MWNDFLPNELKEKQEVKEPSWSKFLDQEPEPIVEPTIEPSRVEQPQVITEAPRDAEGFYKTTAISPPIQGLAPMVWSPEIASYVGKQGFGPQPEGGWDEMLRPLDKEGKPYTLDLPENDLLKTVKTTLKDAAVRSGMELVAASELALSLASGMMLYLPSKIYGLMALPFGAEVAKIAEEEMGSLGYQPFTEKGRAATELVGKGFELFLWPARKAGEITTKEFPRLGYVTEFGYELMEFAVAGGLVKGFRSKLKPEQKTRVIDAKKELDNAELVKKADAVEAIPDATIKEAQRKVIETEKVQADLEHAEAIKKVSEDAMIVEEIGKQTEGIIKAKSEVKPVEVKPELEAKQTKADKIVKQWDKELEAEKRRLSFYKPTEAEQINNFKKVVEDITFVVEDFNSNLPEYRAFGMRKARELIKEDLDAIIEDYVIRKPTPEQLRLAHEHVEYAKEKTNQALVGLKSVKDEVKPKPPKIEELPEFPEAKIKPEEFKEPVTDVDLNIGVELPELKGESSPFFQDAKTTETYKKLYEERAKSVASDPELLTQKLINDVNRWYKGDDSVPIDKVRNSLTELSTRSEELRMEFITGQDHFAWKETIGEAAQWARGLDRLKIEQTIYRQGRPEGKWWTPERDYAESFGKKGKKVIERKLAKDAKLIDEEILKSKLTDIERKMDEMKGYDAALDRLGYDGFKRLEESMEGPSSWSYYIKDRLKIEPSEVTLYRATSPTVKFEDVFDVEKLTKFKPPEGIEGNFYTSDYAYADYFREAYGKDAIIESIKVSAEEAKLYEQRPGEYFVPKDRLKIEPTVDLYAGIPWKDILKKLRITKEGYPKIDTSKLSPEQRKTYNLGKEWDDAFEAAREAKKFKLKRFIDRSGLHTGRAIHERKHRLRRQLRKQYGAEGDKILQYIDTSEASGGVSDRMFYEMRKEAFRDVPSRLTTQVDAVNLASRLTDIYGYKTPAQFKPPKRMGPEQTAVFETLMNVYKRMTPKERELAEKASNTMFDHVKMAVDELVRVGLKSVEEGEALKSHNYRKIRSLNVEKMYDQKYKQGIRIGDKMVRQTDSGVDSLGQNPITMLETDSRILYKETLDRIYRRVKNQEMKLEWREFDAKHADNPFVIFKDNDVVLKRSDRKIPSGYVKDYWYEDGRMKTMYYHPDVALQVLASGPHMSYPLTRVLTTGLGINLTRALTVGTSAFWATTRGLTMDIGHTFFSARSFNPETGKFKRTYSKIPPVYLGQIGKDMANTFYDVMTRGEKTGVYEKNGGSMPFLAMREQHFGKKGIKAPGAYDKIMDGLSFWSQSMERWNRVAVMERGIRQEAKKKGITLEEAYKDKDITMNATNTAVERLPYSQGGWLVKEMDKIFGPFISASYNAARTFLRGAKENPVDFAARISTIAIPTVGATIAMTLFAPEAKRDTPEWQHIGGPVVTLFPDSLNFIDDEGNKRWINVRLPVDPMIAAFYNVFRGLTNKMLYEAGMTDIEPNYETIIDSITRALPTGSSLAPVPAAFFTYFKNIDVWRNKKVVEEAFPWPMSGEEGQLDPKLGQLPKDIGKVTGVSAPRLSAAVRQVGLQNNEYAWAIGKLYDMINNDLDPRLRMQHWAITLSKTPGIKNLMSVTVPRSYALAGRKDLKQQDRFDKMLRREEMNFLSESYYWKGVGSESKIDKFIDKYEEEHIRKSLETRRNFIEKVKDLSHRGSWVSFYHVPPEIKAKEFYKLWQVESSPEERMALERELDDLLDVGYISKASEDRFFETLENLKYRQVK